MQMTRVSLVAALSLAIQGSALACPFCGGKGASGLAENLLLVAALWFGVRALMRAVSQSRTLSSASHSREGA
jgi:hypothetical protein